jgi:O-antigen ligase
MAHRLAGTGLVLVLLSTLVTWQGFGFDEVRRPVALLGAFLVLAAGLRTGFRTPRATWILRLADLALLAHALSVLAADSRTEAAAALFPMAVAWILLRGAALGWIPRPLLEEHGLPLLAVTGLLFAACGISQSLFGDWFGIGLDRRAVSTLGNTNYAGVFSAALAVAGFAMATLEEDPRRIALGLAAALAGVLHVAVSNSMAGALGLTAGAGTVLALRWRRGGFSPAAAFALVALAAAVGVAGGAKIGERAAAIARGEDYTSQVRLGLWKGTLRLAAAHPVLGCGVGNFRMAFPPHRDAGERILSHRDRAIKYIEAEDPHSTPLKALAEAGPVALLALLGALALAIAAGARSARDAPPPAAALAVAAVGGLVSLAVSGCFNSLAGHLPFAVLGGLFAGACVPADPAGVPARSGWGLLAAGGVLVLASIPWFSADRHYRSAMHTPDPVERLGHARAAVAALPGHWRSQYQIAQCEMALGGREGSARAELIDLLEAHPHHVPALVDLARVAGSAEEGERILKRAETIAPEFPLIQNRLAWYDYRRRDFPAVRRRMERILAAVPDEPESIYMMGRVLLWEGDLDAAAKWLRKAFARHPHLKERLAADHPEIQNDPRFADLVDGAKR